MAAFIISCVLPLATDPRRVAGVVLVSTVTSLKPAFLSASSILALSPESLAGAMVVVGNGVGLLATVVFAGVAPPPQAPRKSVAARLKIIKYVVILNFILSS